MTRLMRLGGVLWVVCSLVVGVAILIGSLLHVILIVGYHDNEGEIYTVFVEDTARDFRLSLAGTRCFQPLPPWVYSEEPEQEIAAPDIGRSFTRGGTWAADVLTPLACR